MAQAIVETISLGTKVVIIGIVFLVIGLWRLKKKREFENISSSKISSAAQGLAEFSGFAWSRFAHFNLEGKPTAFTQWQLEIPNGESSQVIAKGFYPEGLFIHDESGAAWIGMKTVKLESKFKCTRWDDLNPEGKSRFLTWLDIPRENFPPQDTNSGYVVCENEISLGSPLVAQGYFFTNKNEIATAAPGLLEFKEKYKSLKGNHSYLLSLADGNNDGELSEDEMKMAYTAAAAAISKKTTGAPLEAVELCGGLKSTEHCALSLHPTHEAYLLKKLGTWVLPLIIGGALVIAVGICILTSLLF